MWPKGSAPRSFTADVAATETTLTQRSTAWPCVAASCPKVYSRPPRNLFPKMLLNVCCHSLEGAGGGGRSTVHGWIITPASSPSLHGFVCLHHLSFNKMFISVALLCNYVQFCQTTSDAGLRALTKPLFLIFSFFFNLVWFYYVSYM